MSVCLARCHVNNMEKVNCTLLLRCEDEVTGFVWGSHSKARLAYRISRSAKLTENTWDGEIIDILLTP
jgi:hypothetical protein